MTKTVVALYDNLANAQNAVQDLANQGFRRDDIGVVANNAQNERQDKVGPDVVTGASSGAGVGAVLGGVAGLLAGIAALTIPGIGPVVAAGPLAAALAGAGVGAVAGGIVGALVDAGVPDEEAQNYAEGVRRGGTLVTVRAADDLADQAGQILNRHGAVDIMTRASQWNAAATGPHSTTGEQPAARPTGQDVTAEQQAASYNTSPMQIDEYIGPTEEETTAPDGEAPGAAYGGAEFKGEERTGTIWNSIWELDAQRDAAGSQEQQERGVGFSSGAGQSGAGYQGAEQPGPREPTSDQPAPTGFDRFDRDFRAHHQLIYGNASDYELFQPAYRFGYDLADQEQSRGLQWGEIEPQIRRDWEQRYPNEPWDNIREVVRYAWERASGSAATGQESRPAGQQGWTGQESRAERPSYQGPQDRQI